MLNRVILCLGSNQNHEKNIAYAAERLRTHFKSIQFSSSYYSEPEGTSYTESAYLNQVAIAETDKTPEEIIPFFKAIEKECGRTPELKTSGIVPLDIDLIQWNDKVLRPKDLNCSYVQKGLQELIS